MNNTLKISKINYDDILASLLPKTFGMARKKEKKTNYVFASLRLSGKKK